ncbi:MAG: 3-deoxy-manno-octulosonate cytidylyltransferase [Deltaproteobacteria bacterium]|nr:MAG: 3-deoxy-manno-octulosonate cytidylyltransferase [Deltaproteobacteria bacterium]
MCASPKCIGIIPARYASARFPGKPLANILGRPMFWHVYHRACQCPDLDQVLLATDDERIRQAAEQLDVPVVMTRPDHPSGSDRILEAARLICVPDDCILVNIQGDEPALSPPMLSQLIDPFLDPAVLVTTLARRIDATAAENPNIVKVVFAPNGSALYFSRAPIPRHRDYSPDPIYYGHIGLYAYRKKALEQFVQWGQSPLEQTEKLEQLRLLENGVPIFVVLTEFRSFGVDHPEDIEQAARLLAAS